MEGLSSLIFLAFLVAIFYFMLIRPQKKRLQEHQRLVKSIGIGDEVVTIGGIHGIVRKIGDEDIELEVAPNTTIRFVRSSVTRRVTEELDEAGTPAETEEEA